LKDVVQISFLFI